MKKILVIGSTGLLGKPVTEALIAAGFDVTILVRDKKLAEKLFPKVSIIKGDLRNKVDVEKAMQNQEAVFLSLSVKQTEKENEFHTESEGIDVVIEVAKELKIKRIA